MMKPESIRPVIIQDSREQLPLAFKTFPSEIGSLISGDYSVKGCEETFAVERKSVADLIMSCTSERDRFTRELHRLRGYHFKRLLVIGSQVEISEHRYRSNALPKAILNSIWSFEIRYDVPVIFEPDPEKAALLIERWSYFFVRELLKIDQTQFTAKDETKQPA